MRNAYMYIYIHSCSPTIHILHQKDGNVILDKQSQLQNHKTFWPRPSVLRCPTSLETSTSEAPCGQEIVFGYSSTILFEGYRNIDGRQLTF